MVIENGLNRERLAVLYMAVVIFAGIVGAVDQVFYLSRFSNIPTYLLFVVFIGVAEFYPVILRQLSITLGFPLVYTFILLFGFPVAVFSYCVLLFIVYLLKRRPLRQLMFAPAQQMISLLSAEGAASLVFSGEAQGFAGLVGRVAVFTGVYFLANNVMVDGLLVIRPQQYQKGLWLRKNFIEVCVASFSFVYLLIMFLLGSQNRGVIDVFSYLFFYSPLVAICLITVIIVRLQKERNRLKALFTLTTELNRLLFSRQWRENIQQLFRHFIDVEATAFWVKTGDDWLLNYYDGAVSSFHKESEEDKTAFSDIHETRLYPNRKREKIPMSSFFPNHLRAFIFAPLQVESETVGMLVVGRSRSRSFTSEEARLMATLANQMAILLKNYNLISEQKKRLLLEERNRIAREIHDGVAQSVAGVVMELETAERLFKTDRVKAETLMRNSTGKLRNSLKEIRQSIYALRPYPTERSGLRKAIRDKIAEMRKKSGPEIRYHEEGQVFLLDDAKERVFYETFQEAMHNCMKHADAHHVEVYLGYEEDHIEMIIQDDGNGFSLVDAMVKAREEPHFGILNMNDLAEGIGATLQIDSAKGEGTKIELIIKNLSGEEDEDDSSYVG
ncbi:MAG TPA: sensor histidine kinase [Bacillales bacterium]|nr:sensor histidine kinase [Bacillales bacterium]